MRTVGGQTDHRSDGLRPGSLVCMSSHGRGGLVRAMVGSIAEALLRTLDRPALVVGPQVSGSHFSGRVVAGVDGSPESERTLAPAREWATLIGQPLWLVEVDDCGRTADRDVPVDRVEAAHVARLGRRAGADGWDVLHDADPARTLVDAATETSSGLLVLASLGRTGWDRLRLGSVTAKVVHGSTVPVLVVPAGTPGPD